MQRKRCYRRAVCGNNWLWRINAVRSNLSAVSSCMETHENLQRIAMAWTWESSLWKQCWPCRTFVSRQDCDSIGCTDWFHCMTETLFPAWESHDFSRRRTVRTIHRVMTPPPLPVGNPPSKIELILVEPTVDMESCVASAIPRLSPWSQDSDKYTFPQGRRTCADFWLKKA